MDNMTLQFRVSNSYSLYEMSGLLRFYLNSYETPFFQGLKQLYNLKIALFFQAASIGGVSDFILLHHFTEV